MIEPFIMELSPEDVTTMASFENNVSFSNFTNGSDYGQTKMPGATIVSPISMFLAGVIGNVLALLVLHRKRHESQRLMFHGLVGGLVWNDLIGIILLSPVTIASYLNGRRMPGGEHLCNFNGFVMICFGLSTPLIVSAMAIERFMFVKYTFFYTKHCSPSRARLLMLIIWAFVLMFGLLPLVGFGEITKQYPWTWCFLNFKTVDPVHAAYGYLYAIINLLLVVVMVVCNLVVVVTLARVRNYRRRQSTSSLTSTYIGEVEDLAKAKQIARRRQKDVELQMIVVMCAITTVFAVCWAPLMIHITLTLASGGNSDEVHGLHAVRLVSVNQTLNPWMYVILRRTLIVRIKKSCCRLRKFCRTERKRPLVVKVPSGRRHRYVHVRNQLCHMDNFVGGDIDINSFSDNIRKSMYLHLSAAISLPDVMMVNTGRRELDLPMPDVTKAHSFGGRISHSLSLNNVHSVGNCRCQWKGQEPSSFLCPQCSHVLYSSVFKTGGGVPKVGVQNGHIRIGDGDNSGTVIVNSRKGKKRGSKLKELFSRPDSKSEAGNESERKISRQEHYGWGNRDTYGILRTGDSLEMSVGPDMNTANFHQSDTNTSSSSRMSSKNRSGISLHPSKLQSTRNPSSKAELSDFQIKQYIQIPLPNSVSTSFASGATAGTKNRSSSKSYSRPSSRHSASTDTPTPSAKAPENHSFFWRRRTDSSRSGEYPEVFLDDHEASSGTDSEGEDDAFVEETADATTDDCAFSSTRTESLFLSETVSPGATNPPLNNSYNYSPSEKLANGIKPVKNKLGHSSQEPKYHSTGRNAKPSFRTAVPKIVESEPEVTSSGPDSEKLKLGYLKACPDGTSECMHVTSDENASSGIFSVDSSAKLTVCESQSAPAHEESCKLSKTQARRVKSDAS